jgi:hypothetical protein
LPFIFLYVGLMAIFCGVALFMVFFFVGVCVLLFLSRGVVWCGVSRLLVEFLRVPMSVYDSI